MPHHYAELHHKKAPTANSPPPFVKRQGNPCATGAWITSPKAGDIVDATNPIHLAWDTSANCIDGNPDKVVIYLHPIVSIKPNDTNIQTFAATYGEGQADLTVDPAAFTGRANPVELQFAILGPGEFTPQNALGPRFKATPPVINVGGTGTDPTSALSAAAALTTKATVVNNLSRPTGLSKGAIAAAVIMPILAVAAAIGVYVFFSRKKEAARRRRFSQAVDKRMSTLSGDWKSISAAGAQAAIRASMAGGPERASAFFGNGRPTSTFGLETEEQQMGQLPRPRITAVGGDGTARVSRVSFAESAIARQSKDGGEKFDRGSTYSRTSRAFQPPVPPLPHHLKDTVRASTATEDTLDAINEKSGAYAYGMSQDQNDEIGNLEMSPTQATGPRPYASPFVLGEDRGSIDVDLGRDVMGMPAMAMMRQSDDDHEAYGGSQTIFNASPTDPTYGTQLPAVPSPTLQTSYAMHPYSADAQMVSSPTQYTSSPFAGFSGPVASSTPDDLLRAYASRSATAPTTPVAGTSPDAMLKAYASRSGSGSKPGTPSNGGMRTLYAQPPPPPPAATRQGSLAGSNNPYRETMVSRYSDDEDDEQDISAGKGGHVGHAA